MIKINGTKIAGFILFLFPILIAITKYSNTDVTVLSLYTVLSILLFILYPKRIINKFLEQRIVHYVFLLFISLTVSTIIFNISFIGGTLLQLTFLFDIFVLSCFADIKLTFKYFSNFTIVLSIISIIGYLFNIDFFASMKANSNYVSIDLLIGGGISTIFEFRHYYAIFVTMSILYEFYFPQKNTLIKFSRLFILIINLLLTYTRNSWISCIVCLLIMVAVRSRKKISIQKNTLVLGGIILSLMIVLMIIFSKQVDPIIQNVFSRFSELFNNKSTNDFMGARGYSLRYGTKYIFNHLKYLFLGGGNAFALAWLKVNPYYYWNVAIDNQFVTIFMNQGIIGILLIVRVVVETCKYLGTKNNRIQQFIALSLVSIFISMMFFEIFANMNSILPLFLILICGLNQREFDN